MDKLQKEYPAAPLAKRASFGRKLRRALFFLRGYFFPCACALCDAPLAGINENWYGLCEECRHSLEAEAEKHCEKCGRPLVSEKNICMACRRGQAGSCDRIKVFFPYSGKNRKLLAEYKFGKNRALGNFFAEKITQFLAENVKTAGTALVPVPPRPGKIKEKGWDQVEYLASLLEKQGLPGGMKVCRCLKRLKSGAQKELSRKERMENLKNRIVLRGDAHQCVRGSVHECVMIIDDVITTGATLDACASALKSGGVKKVHGLCLFYD
ncbi:MAG: double zinc ribbon domain-containing protein [Spirochaetes bacterium]|nr:double zinc ribbon domain-containing protein [Spirochaetota bacterium]